MLSKQIFIVLLLLAVQNADGQRPRLREVRQHKAGEEKTTSEPDYSNLYFWAAHPLKKDPADSIPAFLKNEKRDSAADVFYIHPTTFTKDLTAGWNADLNNKVLNDQTDSRPVLFQASIFNGSCKVYAPRYRQAHLKAFFMTRSPQSKDAFDMAYSDVKTAFEYYLSHHNQGRPIVIASHSQGSLHAIRLLKEFFDNKPLQKKLVCAYVVGWPIKKGDFNAIPLGTTATQTGCVVGWRTYRNGKSDKTVENENGNSLCVNPVTWTALGETSDKTMHKGMILKDFNVLYPRAVAAEVDTKSNILWADLPDQMDESKGKLNNYHFVDFNLFYMDVRENVKARINTYLKNNRAHD